MPLFICDKCGCVENTALGHYWSRDDDCFGKELQGKALCSECEPPVYADGSKNEDGGQWHGRFVKSFPTDEAIAEGRYINRTKTGKPKKSI